MVNLNTSSRGTIKDSSAPCSDCKPVSEGVLSVAQLHRRALHSHPVEFEHCAGEWEGRSLLASFEGARFKAAGDGLG